MPYLFDSTFLHGAGRYDYICFRDSDLDKLPTENVRPGCLAIFANSGKVYVFTDTKEWLEFGSGFSIAEPIDYDGIVVDYTQNGMTFGFIPSEQYDILTQNGVGTKFLVVINAKRGGLRKDEFTIDEINESNFNASYKDDLGSRSTEKFEPQDEMPRDKEELPVEKPFS